METCKKHMDKNDVVVCIYCCMSLMFELDGMNEGKEECRGGKLQNIYHLLTVICYFYFTT